MSKLSTTAITQSDIEDYLSNYSDFSFELRVLKELKYLGLICEHSGTYNDPVTDKYREFDIRALYQSLPVRIHLSVECKNIKSSFPLVMHCLQRSSLETYNDLIHSFNHPQKKMTPFEAVTSVGQQFRKYSERLRARGEKSLYSNEDYVAKSSDQVGRSERENSIINSDREVFEKISQAINSAKDLIDQAHRLRPDVGENIITFVCPVLVIPDLCLWQVNYSEDGSVTGKPEQTNHLSYYIGKEWASRFVPPVSPYILSHLEIVTFSEIKPFIKNYIRNYSQNIKKTFESKFSEESA